MSISYVITSYSQFQEKKLLVKLFLNEIKPKQNITHDGWPERNPFAVKCFFFLWIRKKVFFLIKKYMWKIAEIFWLKQSWCKILRWLSWLKFPANVF